MLIIPRDQSKMCKHLERNKTNLIEIYGTQCISWTHKRVSFKQNRRNDYFQKVPFLTRNPFPDLYSSVLSGYCKVAIMYSTLLILLNATHYQQTHLQIAFKLEIAFPTGNSVGQRVTRLEKKEGANFV